MKRIVSISQATILCVFFSFFVCLAANCADIPKPTLGVILDDTRLQFPDPMFGFLRIENTTEGDVFMTTLPSSGEITLSVGVEVFRVHFDTGIGGIYVKTEPPGRHSTIPFKINYAKDQAMILAILSGKSIVMGASVSATPKHVPILNGEPLRQGSWTDFDGFDVVKSAKVEVVMENMIGNWIFLPGENNFIQQCGDAKNWQSMEQVHDRFNPVGGGYEGKDHNLSFLDSLSIQFLPVLSVFPDRLDDIHHHLRCETASWRWLMIRQALRRYYMNPHSQESDQQIVNDIIVTLRCCGLAELFTWERWISQAFSNGPDNYTIENYENNLNRKLDDYWATRLSAEFPGMPLGGLVRASKYGDDENYIECDQIDLRVLSPALSTLEKWKVSGAIGTAPCDCENLKTLLRQSPLSIQNQSRPSSN